MKKLLLLTATGLILQATPVLASDYGDGQGRQGKNGQKGEMFAKHDTNGDGVISESEFLAHAKVKFAEKDANSDGSISKEEAQAAHAAKRAKRQERRSQQSSKQSSE